MSGTPGDNSPAADAVRGAPWSRTITGYVVTVAEHALERIATLAAESTSAHRYAIITDDTVRGLYAEQVSERFPSGAVTTHSVAAGEASKTRESWARLTDELLASGHGRDSAIIALGGGVVGDLAGFVAATYMRGIPFVQVPTTLLAMIDASVGGKTAVDTPAGKNLVGAFHRPAAVLIDPDVLATLPLRELRGGLAEAIKHGAVANATYFDWVRRWLPVLLGRRQAPDSAPGRNDSVPERNAASLMVDLITRSVEIKGRIVERDERETGIRRILNFGHTVGHAIEALSGYRLLHGEAIAIGMALEAELAERAGIAERGTAATLRDVLGAAGLPTERPQGIEPVRVVEMARGDKKARGGMIELALPLAIGRMAGEERGWSVHVGDQLLLEVLEERAGPEWSDLAK